MGKAIGSNGRIGKSFCLAEVRDFTSLQSRKQTISSISIKKINIKKLKWS